jgi:hypothetical protein
MATQMVTVDHPLKIPPPSGASYKAIGVYIAIEKTASCAGLGWPTRHWTVSLTKEDIRPWHSVE